ncbi:MAG: hypothetical protein SVY53_04710, partial [Chloroflexota bacterium]|nr:hypothetical protein [Chloroflexota bacterium]
MKKRLTVLFLMILVVALLLPGSILGSSHDTGEQANLYVIHGINGSDLSLDPALPVDVLVNDSICLLEGLTFQEVVGPVALDPGTYNIKIGLANSDNPCSNDPVIEA